MLRACTEAGHDPARPRRLPDGPGSGHAAPRPPARGGTGRRDGSARRAGPPRLPLLGRRRARPSRSSRTPPRSCCVRRPATAPTPRTSAPYYAQLPERLDLGQRDRGTSRPSRSTASSSPAHRPASSGCSASSACGPSGRDSARSRPSARRLGSLARADGIALFHPTLPGGAAAGLLLDRRRGGAARARLAHPGPARPGSAAEDADGDA